MDVMRIKAKCQMNSKNEKNNIAFDLEERTALFGESIIEFAKLLSRDQVNNVLIGQIVRSGTSVGTSNYPRLKAVALDWSPGTVEKSGPHFG